jgi:alcohol dehydrogenase
MSKDLMTMMDKDTINKPFSFHLPTRIEIGEGILEQTAAFIDQTIAGRKIFIVTDPGIQRIGLVERVEQLLKKEGYTLDVFNQVHPNPKDVDCLTGAEAAQAFGADAILAIGGGSVIDSAKAIAVLQTHGGRVQDVEGRSKVQHQVTPIVAIPTTAGTGSEVTRSAVITDTDRHFKMTIKDVKLAPRLAIIDPETTYNLPAPLTASTGMDALVHAIEAYTCKLSNPTADALALGAMSHLYPHLREAVHNGHNREARYHMMVGSLIAGMAFSHADVAAVHCMAEAIGGRYDTPHGVANSMFLPYVTEHNASSDIFKHAHIARVCGIVNERMSDEEATDFLVEELKQLAKDISIPSFGSLAEADPLDFEALAEASFRNGSTPSNAREITKEDYVELFKKAYES